jgi:hypothetical protein
LTAVPAGNREWGAQAAAARPWRRILAILSVCGLIEATLCIVFLRTEGGCYAVAASLGDDGAKPALPENETGAFSARRLDPLAGYRPTFRVSWRNLRSEDGRVGILSTPLCKTVTVEGLQVQSYQYSRADEARQDNTASIQSLYDIGRQLKEEAGGMRLESPLLDIRRAAKVVIRDLDYSAFRDDQLELGVQCRYATGAPASSQIVLRGGVRIQANGGALVAGCVQWDVDTNQIAVPGTYVLTRDGVSVRGRGFHCDLHWRPSVAHEVNGRKGAGRWAEAVSF